MTKKKKVKDGTQPKKMERPTDYFEIECEHGVFKIEEGVVTKIYEVRPKNGGPCYQKILFESGSSRCAVAARRLVPVKVGE